MVRRSVDVDMESMALAWEDDSPDTAYYLDVETGVVELVQRDLLDLNDLTDEIERNRERYLYMPKPKAAQLRSDLNDFIKDVQDNHLKCLLEVACEASNPLHSCKALLQKYPQQWSEWEAFRLRRVHVRIRQWLEANFLVDSKQVECAE